MNYIPRVIRKTAKKIIYFPFEFLYGNELIKRLTPYSVRGFEEKMRVGPHGDGGYIIPVNIVKLIDVVYSYGVGKNISFEKNLSLLKELIFRFYDAAVDNLPYRQGNFFFKKENIGRKKHGIFGTFQGHLIENGDFEKRILLKMDIEGDEWKVIRSILNGNYKNISAIILELHHLGRYEKLAFYNRILKSINSKFTLVHIHANNFESVFNIKGKILPMASELTLINNNLVTQKSILNSGLPSVHDFPNDAEREDIRLDFWL